MAYTTIDDPTAYFQTKLYTGNSSTQVITFDGNTDMQPDFVWSKPRVSGGHFLSDSIRGGTKVVQSASTGAEITRSSHIQSFNTNGYTLAGDGTTNSNGDATVSWSWKETATAGFDIVSYTGNGSNPRTISHNLSAVPKMIIVKNRDQATDWNIYHEKIGNDKTILLNTTNASFSSSVWNSTTPTSSVFSLGANDVNTNNIKYIAYCFADVKGYSKFSSYTGNGNADGTFIYTGFKPAWVIFKRSDGGSENWLMYDNKRNTFNVVDKRLYPDANDSEDTGSHMDFVSNGIKLKTSTGGLNSSGATYIYMAFAENPFVTSTGIPSCAR